MELYRVHIIFLFLSLAIAATVLIDGVTHLSMAKSDFDNTPAGKIGWTNLMMYEIIVPVLSVFGLLMHIFGLHLDFVSFIPETASEGLITLLGTAAHGAAWLTISSMWTACEVGTLKWRTVSNNTGATTSAIGDDSSSNTGTSTNTNQPDSIIVNRSGPAFCPQHKFLDGGYSLEGPIPQVKLALGWLLFVITLANLFFAAKAWNDARHGEYYSTGNISGPAAASYDDSGRRKPQEMMTQYQQQQGPLPTRQYWISPTAGAGRSNMAELSGSYETKV